jgi:spermidine synthase
MMYMPLQFYALAFPEILASFTEIYSSVYQASFEDSPYLYQGFRFSIVVIVLLPPTILLGATLPLVVRQFANNQLTFGKNVGFFYTLNTLGALFGTLLAGFVFLPVFGLTSTTIAAIVINMAIGVLAIFYGLEHQVQKAPDSGKTKLFGTRLSTKQRAILGAIFLSGLGALALEVVWVRVLVQSFSATVYAFSIMLACFLFGIFFGSHLVSKNVDQSKDPISYLIQLELWLAGTVAAMIPLIFFAPDLFGAILWRLGSESALSFTIGSIVAQFLVASALIIVPTTLLGATIPVAAKAFLYDIEQRSNSVATVYAFNTAGAVIGALAGGFLLLPLLGHRLSLVAVAIIFALAALVLIMMTKSKSASAVSVPKRAMTSLMQLGLFTVGLVAAFTLPSQTVVNFNLQESKQPDVIYHSVGSSLSVDLVRTDDGNIIMMVNGNIEADTTLLQRRHFVLKAVLPALLSDNQSDAAIVGLGLGITTKTLLDIPQVEHVRLIELTPRND